MLHFAFPQLVQIGPPTGITFQVFCDVLRNQNVAGVAAIHNPLGDIDSCAGDVRALVDIRHLVNRPAVYTHPHVQIRMAFQRLTNLQCALDGRFDRVSKD
jgi:hypothetical protein